ncbi:MAG: homoserine O-acetyltransferase MetA [Streptococcus thermophilus]|uniref:Homoserine O-acetyltransferase n=1 Tax=Streptococcus thermophilus TaxID=1308 RepID=A0A2X3UYB9_STRTR|nr:homoserine O-succinyltransferase [Streptococcus thermophilus]MBO1146817.1 homoserine O-succinyltransferase [Streptococcus thermophilus]MBO1150319.1 homoserine O-succinyltransferase [Streptococcus thermophilus]MBO1151938.1 homoserine O-succinyltransferase [Streptococcus thermophilus]MBO1153547.1 homoserine O-succinyltransferase [Streptococcus thermophilus]MBO1154972.1 homoserine O-succinyltransferase [Streptococcus thermophilus]
MPIKLDNKLPALDVLRSENVFIMDENRASSQDIRPMEVLILNLMPTKEVTETQLLRLLANTPLQINVEFLYMASHKSKNTHAEHMKTFYKTFDEIKDKYYDGLIVTGAPIEQMPFEEVDYWHELTRVFDWSKKHVYSTLHLCWGAQAGLYYKHGVDKVPLSEKLSGIYKQTVDMPENFLMNGFDDSFVSPHSRYTEVTLEDIKNKTDLDVVASGQEVGLSILASKDLREVYSFGHFEYDRDTLAREYRRDLEVGINPDVPANYFPGDDPSQEPKLRWNLAASTFFSNWINYAVYQETPYRLEELEDDFSFYGYL